MRRIITKTDEGGMQAIDFGDTSRDTAALWLHATGFNAMTYQSILAPLGVRTRVAALDMRGHGRTKLPADPKSLKSWHTYRDDVIAFLDKNMTRPVVLGGHSMGGCVALLVAGKRPDLVKGLVLVDPVILSKRFYLLKHVFPFLTAGNKMARQARKRRNGFASIEDARESYQGRGAFRTWREPFLKDYLTDGLVQSNDGSGEGTPTWKLSCDPAWEAATFDAQRNRPWGALQVVKKENIPTIIIRPAQAPVLSDRVVEDLSRANPDILIRQRPHTSHFYPMEAPYEVRNELSTAISRLIEGFSASEEGQMRRSFHGSGEFGDFDR